MAILEAIVAPARNCPNCGRQALPEVLESRDFLCPQCGCNFCSCCFKPDYKGHGDYVFCPACGIKLFFPSL